jgi:hypothetical protein
MSGSESLECEAPASLWISQETVRIIRSNPKRHPTSQNATTGRQVCRPSINSGQAVQSQAGVPDRETISEWRGYSKNAVAG